MVKFRGSVQIDQPTIPVATKPPSKQAQLPLEFSRPLKVTAITQRLDTISIEATLAECAALAARFELVSLESLSATLEYRRLTGTQRIRIDGTIQATTAQHCVASWEPVPETINENFVADFTQTVWEAADTEIDQPEVITEDTIDLGEIVAQYFYLALDSYPRVKVAEPPPEKPKRIKKAAAKITPVNNKLVRPIANKSSATTATIEAFTATVSNAPVKPETSIPPPIAANDETPNTRSSLFMQHLQKLKDQR